MLQSEIRRWEEFRDEVRLADPGHTDTDVASAQTEDIVAEFANTVMATPDFDEVYNESIEESLKHELQPSLAEILLSKEPFTQRVKRNLLVATSSAIDRREDLLEVLEVEYDTLESTANDLEAIRERAESVSNRSNEWGEFDEVVVANETCESLKRRCETLLEERQREIRDSGMDRFVDEETHVLNLYLYGDLETEYPVLSAITTTYQQIQSVQEEASRFDTLANLQ